jgi:hypothetical protein
MALEPLEMLVESLQLLAADPADQARLLRDSEELADDLALTFEGCYLTVEEMARQGLLTPRQQECLGEVDALLESLPDDQWSPQAVQTSPRWDEVRRAAARALEALGRPRQLPRLEWVSFEEE